MAIGAHTQTHPILSSEAAEDSRAQIVDSIRELSEFVGQQVVAFAYPNGMAGLDFSDREKRTLEQCGIRLSFTTRTGFFERTTDPLEIPRIGFAGSRHETRAWISGKLLLTPVWDRSRDLLTRTSPAIHRQRIQSVRCPKRHYRAWDPRGVDRFSVARTSSRPSEIGVTELLEAKCAVIAESDLLGAAEVLTRRGREVRSAQIRRRLSHVLRLAADHPRLALVSATTG